MNRIVEWIVRMFGSIWFLLIFNIATAVWIGLGLFDPHFFDPFPSNFYTLLVSWMAIDLSSLVLWTDRRNKEREDRERRKEANTISALLNLSESNQRILKYLLDKEEMSNCD